MPPSNLNQAQRQAVLTIKGPLLVIAGAGAGKTRVIIERIRNIIREGAPPESILAITFTNKAAAEMRSRLPESARFGNVGPFISTFHSLGLTLIKENAKLLGFKHTPAIYDRADSLREVKQALKAMDVEDLEPRTVLSVISRNKGEGVSAGAYAEKASTWRDRLIAQAWLRYESALHTEGALDFDDLLVRAVRLLETYPEVREACHKRWHYMHVDEYQDTNGIQARLTELLVGKEKNICVVGDMDQCLIEGTSVSMANGTEKPIEDIRKGEWVLSNYGSGDVRPARVTKTLTRSHSGTLITITTKTGRVITSTPQHIHFAGYRQGLTPDLYFTYLMQKQGIGWRLGVSQTYTNGQKSTVLGFQQRCNQEHGDAVWIIASHATPQEARILEYKLSLQYGIPTIPFVARKGGSTNGYVHDQKIINSIFASIHTEDVARKLLTDYNLSEIYPSHRAQATRSTRRNIIVSLCGDRRGASPMHRISLAGSDEAGKNILRIAGFSVRPAKLGSSGWRFETARASYDAIRIIVEKLQALFPEVHVRELARLGGKKKNPKDVSSLPFLPAASVQTGMVMFDAGGGYDIVERVDTVSNKKVRVFDLNIEKTHNFIGNGIVTHNCIYGWRGAQMENMLQFEKKYGGEVIVMEENYRSTKAILSAANSLISNNTGRPEKNLFTKNADGEPLSLYIAGDGGDEASFVARKIQEHIDEGRAPKDFAVLYRANFQSRSIEEKLLANHISYQVLGTRFFERKEVKDVLSFVRAGVSPNSADLGRVLDTLSGIGKVSKLKILSGQEAQLTRKAHERVVAMREVLSWIESTASTTPPSTLVREVIAKSGVEQTLKEDKLEGTERLENLAELVTLAARYDTLPAPEGLEKFLESAALASDQDDLKEEKNQVRLMTVHAAKGLEFPYVFIIGLEEGLFPYEREDDTKNNLEEERRLMYVALTRAQQKVYLSYAMMRTIFGNTEMRTNSQFLNELPGDLLQNEVPERLGKTIYLD